MTLLRYEDATRVASAKEIKQLIEKSLSRYPNARRVLLIHPDYSRHDFTHVLAPTIYRALKKHGLERLDTLNAPGTHRPMTARELRKKLGLNARFQKLGRMFNHEFAAAGALVKVGELSEGFVAEQTQGFLNRSIPVTVNKILYDDYDLVIVLNAVKTHEATGWSGLQKMIVPGIAGESVVGGFHWGAVLSGIPNIIAELENPGRAMVNEAVRQAIEKLGSTPLLWCTMVCEDTDAGHGQLRALYTDEGIEGAARILPEAAKFARGIYIVGIDRGLDIAVQVLGVDYDEIWTGGKGSYYLQRPGVLNPGAEIIIYAPHIHCFHSDPEMDADIRRIGYHGREYVIDFCKRHPDFNLNVAAHVINVRGLDESQFKVTLATGISEEDCRAVSLGYRDPKSILESDFQGPGKLWIPNGGVFLYDLN